jgi:hypothetical protein
MQARQKIRKILGSCRSGDREVGGRRRRRGECGSWLLFQDRMTSDTFCGEFAVEVRGDHRRLSEVIRREPKRRQLEMGFEIQQLGKPRRI